MRLPLRHPPPGVDAVAQRCAHLDALAAALIGVPLGPAAGFLTSSRSRGRHGNALQWHLGLAAHDNEGVPDWEGRIEIKLVSVWRRPGGAVGCDKLKISDIGIDPWAKLSNVLWVFADRITRVVVDCRRFVLAGAPREDLERAWAADPHFDEPALFVEAREQRVTGQPARRAPAYYLASRFFAEHGLLPAAGPSVLGFDAAWWKQTHAEHGRDPVTHVATAAGAQACRRCGGPLTFDIERLASEGWTPARHGMPMQGDCAVRGHLVVDPQGLTVPQGLDADDTLALVEERVPPGAIWRVCDHVPEPADHLH